MNLKDLQNDWINEFPKPLIIAGPCSAESEAQMMETAQRLKESGAEVPVFRAGIWKPRTRPGGFEGVGEIGLKWLQKAKAETGLQMAVEVANAAHVKLALEHDIDVLWIGARTTVNPFAVQEIADALQNTEKIVLVKNPVNPDLALWIGGVERLYNANIKNLGKFMVIPKLMLEIYGKDGQKLLALEAPSQKVYPFTCKDFDIEIKDLPAGKYEAVLIADYGQNLFGTNLVIEID